MIRLDHALFRAQLLDAVGIAVVATDLRGRITYWNGAAELLYGHAAAQAVGRHIAAVTGYIPAAQTVADVLAAMPSGQRSGEFVATHRDGHQLLVEVVTQPVCDPDGTVTAIVGVSTDISARRRGEQLLTHRVLHDPLTGLANRLLLDDRLRHALARSAGSSGQVVVLFLDVDRFKSVNDRLGHAAGDALLVELSHRLQGAIRGDDILARFSGDEFVIVCDGLTVGDADRLAERISAIMVPTFDLGEHRVAVTLSLGMATATDEDTVDTVLLRADAAMYRRKARGLVDPVIYSDRPWPGGTGFSAAAM